MILGISQHNSVGYNSYSLSFITFINGNNYVTRMRRRQDGSINSTDFPSMDRYRNVASPSVIKGFRLEFVYE